MTSRRRLLLSLLIVAAPPVVCIPLVLSWRDRLPDRLASHWSGSAAPDSFTDRDAFLTWWPTVSITLLVAGVLISLLLRRGRRIAVAVIGGIAGFTASLGPVLALPNLDLADPVQARVDWELALILPLLVGTAWLAWWAHGRAAMEVISADAPPAAELPRLDPDEPARFAELVMQWWLTGIVTGLLAGLGVIVWVVGQPWLGAELVVFGLLVAALTVSRVRVSERDDVSLSAGPLTHRVPIAELTGARVVPKVHPFGDYGGWGLRFVPGVVAMVTRSGPGVEIGRTNGRRVVITTGRAERLAAVVNTLLDRRFGTP